MHNNSFIFFWLHIYKDKVAVHALPFVFLKESSLVIILITFGRVRVWPCRTSHTTELSSGKHFLIVPSLFCHLLLAPVAHLGITQLWCIQWTACPATAHGAEAIV